MSSKATRYELVDPSSKAQHLCLVKYCRRKRAPHRLICHCHHVRAWRKRSPDKAAYQTLKDHAKRRKITFTLTLKQFLDIAVSSGYIDKKGNFAQDLQLDRIDPTRGYEANNIQVISCSENSRKGATFDKQAYKEYHKNKRNEDKQPQEEQYDDNCPF